VIPRDDLNDLLRASRLTESLRWGGRVSLLTQTLADQARREAAAESDAAVEAGPAGDGELSEDRSQPGDASPRAVRPPRTASS
jgi:hypothetical protein